MSNEGGHARRRLAALTKFANVDDVLRKEEDVSRVRLLIEWPG